MFYTGFVPPTPTVELIKAECDAFDPENQLVEDALGQLFAQFPKNTETSHVLLKVLALNKLYKTQINDIDIEPLARHIAGLDIDQLLAQPNLRAVDLITNCPDLQKNFSFATKYCSWHNPTAYPIYDRNVDECLWRYKKQDQFAKFNRKDLRVYEKFLAVVTSFVSFYVLDALTFKQIDKFLWRLGDRVLKEKAAKSFEEKKAEASRVATAAVKEDPNT
jgi:hypothetical protein